MTTSKANEVKDNVWLTFKIRVYAQKRYNNLSNATYSWLTATSVALILISLFADELSGVVPFFDKLTIAFSVILLAMSQITHSFDFANVATKHRLSYLDLQHLHDTWDERDNPVEDYHAILKKYPNHGDVDFENFLFDRKIIQGRSVKINGTEMTLGYLSFIRCVFIKLVMLSLTYLVPALLVLGLLWALIVGNGQP